MTQVANISRSCITILVDSDIKWRFHAEVTSDVLT